MNDLRGGGVEKSHTRMSRGTAPRAKRCPFKYRNLLSRGSVRPAFPNLCPTMGEPAGPVAACDDVQRSQIAEVQGVSGRVAPLFATPRTITAVIGNVIGGIVWFAVAFAFVALLGSVMNAI